MRLFSNLFWVRLGLIGVGFAGTSGAEQIVVSFSSQTGEARVGEFSETQSGDVAPARAIADSGAHLGLATYAALDPLHHELFVSHGLAGSPQGVAVYDQATTGVEPEPKRELGGGVAQISDPRGIAIDPVHQELVVTSSGQGVLVFGRTQSGGGAGPLRSLTLPSFNGQANGIFIDLDHDELYIAFQGFGAQPDAVYVYPRTASGAPAPLRTISGAATGLVDPTGLFVDLEHGEIVVSNQNGSITVFARTDDGDIAPQRTLAGLSTLLASPRGLAVTRDAELGELIVANVDIDHAPNLMLLAFARTATGDTAPARIVGGTSAAFPGGLFPIGVTSSRAVAMASGFAGSLAWIFFDGFELGSATEWSAMSGF